MGLHTVGRYDGFEAVHPVNNRDAAFAVVQREARRRLGDLEGLGRHAGEEYGGDSRGRACDGDDMIELKRRARGFATGDGNRAVQKCIGVSGGGELQGGNSENGGKLPGHWGYLLLG